METVQQEAPQVSEPVEQITKIPESVVRKPKKRDPKKVAAGKALARKNKEAREAAAAAKKREDESESESGLFSLDNIQKAATLVGAGFTLYHGWSAVTGKHGKRFEAAKPKELTKGNEAPENNEEAKSEEQPLPASPKTKGIDMD